MTDHPDLRWRTVELIDGTGQPIMATVALFRDWTNLEEIEFPVYRGPERFATAFRVDGLEFLLPHPQSVREGTGVAATAGHFPEEDA